MSDRVTGQQGKFSEPALDLTFKNFVASLVVKIAEHVKMKQLGTLR